MTVGAILPALNAARFLPQVIGAIRAAQPQVRVLVVDDGSGDTTAETARLEGAHVIAHPRNLGKGMALRTGYAWAQEQGLDWVFTLDSDGQHLPGRCRRSSTPRLPTSGTRWSARAWPAPRTCPGCASGRTSPRAG
ncbi:MAG: glycosyltransferase family 2 protein [bacterium]|nr:glycosyltransferase family 2 protein [bacterium]